MDKDVLRFASIAVVAMCFIALYPQIDLWISQGSNWHGSYVVSNYDETAYSAYVNGLIHGRPHKSDPFLVQEDNDNTPQPETLYSIQFLPAYAVALPARLLGLSASTAFIFLTLFVAIFSTLALIFLFYAFTGNSLFSAVSAVVVLCFGTAVAYQGELRYLIDGRILVDFLPFLRRYQPGIAFPLFFIFCVFVWRTVFSERSNRLWVYSAVCGTLFAVLIFSYFYLWTAAAAWMACFGFISLIINRQNRKQIIVLSTVVGVFSIAALIPYFYLLTLRSPNLDSVQLLASTRSPEFASPSMILGLIVAVVTTFFIKVRSENIDKRLVTVILSFALTPIILFNQQIITGRSLQPVHYEIFIANYLVLISAMLLFWSVMKTYKTASFRRGLIYLGIIALGWGFFEAYGSTSRNSIAAEIRDNSVPAIEYASSSNDKPEDVVIHATNFVTADFIASASNARSLWNAHTSSAGGVNVAENKRLFYLYLYYSGLDSGDLAEVLKQHSFEVTSAIFGAERALPSLGTTNNAITLDEIQIEAKKFADFSSNFSVKDAAAPVLTSIIVPTEAEPDFANLDRWYQRDKGKSFGLFTVYKLTPKFASSEHTK